MIRLDAEDLRSIASALDELELVHGNHNVTLVGHNRSELTTPSGEVINVNRVDDEGSFSREPDGRYVVEIDEQ